MVVYGLGAVCVLTWLILRFARVFRITRSASPAPQPLAQFTAGLAKRMGLAEEVEVLVTPEPINPLWVWLLRPKIVLPAKLVDGAPPAGLEALIAHQLAHHRRSDAAANLGQWLLCAAWWFNPFVWALHHKLQRTKEVCCDDAVIGAGLLSADRYIQAFDAAAGRLSSANRPGLVRDLGFADALPLPAWRAQRLADPQVRHAPRLTGEALVALAVLAIAVLPGIRTTPTTPPAPTPLFTITVRVVDSATNQPLPELSLRIADGRKVRQQRVDNRGATTIDLYDPEGRAAVSVFRTGFMPFHQPWEPADGQPTIPDELVIKLQKDPTEPGRVSPRKQDRPRVGFVVSHYTATGPHSTPAPYGYLHASSISDLLKRELDVYAVIEPESRQAEDLSKALEAFGLGNRWIDGASADRLAELDVVIVNYAFNMTDTMVDSLLEAAQRGTRLFICASGILKPGHGDPRIAQLHGVSALHYICPADGNKFKFRVAREHPLLKEFKKGDEFPVGMAVNGVAGDGDAVSLLDVEGPDEPIFISHYEGKVILPRQVKAIAYHKIGNGTVLVFNWWHFSEESSPKLHPQLPFSNAEFFTRSIHWLTSQ